MTDPKLLFVGDIHLSSHAPTSRKDPYPLTILNKVSYVVSLAKADDWIVLLGDVFHHYHTDDLYLNRILNVLRASKARIFSIVGNHDMKPKSRHPLEDSSLGVLFSSGLVTKLEKENFHGWTLIGCSYGCELPEIDSDEKVILCAHMFYGDAYKGLADKSEVLDESWVEENKPSFVVLGHDHNVYENVLVSHDQGYSTILRPGALSRGTAHGFNKVRDIYTIQFSVNGSYLYVKVPSLPPEEIFVEEEVQIKLISHKIKMFADLLRKRNRAKFQTIEGVLDELEIEPEIRRVLFEYLRAEGIIIQGGAMK